MIRRYVTNTVELLYLSLMQRWEKSAPPNRHKGYLDGMPANNSQTARFAFVLKKIALGSEERTYQLIARRTRRRDGHSYVSRDASWMISPYPLSNGWHLEGCTNLDNQKLAFTECLNELGLSATFIAAVDAFVAGNSIADYLPNAAEQEEIVVRLRSMGELDFESPNSLILID
jgi:hypothetical protein